jgi:hypothetical protein
MQTPTFLLFHRHHKGPALEDYVSTNQKANRVPGKLTIKLKQPEKHAYKQKLKP